MQGIVKICTKAAAFGQNCPSLELSGGCEKESLFWRLHTADLADHEQAVQRLLEFSRPPLHSLRFLQHVLPRLSTEIVLVMYSCSSSAQEGDAQR